MKRYIVLNGVKFIARTLWPRDIQGVLFVYFTVCIVEVTGLF